MTVNICLILRIGYFVSSVSSLLKCEIIKNLIRERKKVRGKKEWNGMFDKLWINIWVNYSEFNISVFVYSRNMKLLWMLFQTFSVYNKRRLFENVPWTPAGRPKFRGEQDCGAGISVIHKLIRVCIFYFFKCRK